MKLSPDITFARESVRALSRIETFLSVLLSVGIAGVMKHNHHPNVREKPEMLANGKQQNGGKTPLFLKYLFFFSAQSSVSFTSHIPLWSTFLSRILSFFASWQIIGVLLRKIKKRQKNKKLTFSKKCDHRDLTEYFTDNCSESYIFHQWKHSLK